MRYIFKNKSKKENFETDDVVEAWNYYSNCYSDNLELIQKFDIQSFDDVLPVYDNDTIEIVLTTSLAYTVNQLRKENEALKQQVTDLEDEIEEMI